MDGLNHLLKASSKAIVEKCLNLVFACRSDPSAVRSSLIWFYGGLLLDVLINFCVFAGCPAFIGVCGGHRFDA
jgi:hypothetical protein